jgi:hypothetical protein
MKRPVANTPTMHAWLVLLVLPCALSFRPTVQHGISVFGQRHTQTHTPCVKALYVKVMKPATLLLFCVYRYTNVASYQVLRWNLAAAREDPEGVWLVAAFDCV